MNQKFESILSDKEFMKKILSFRSIGELKDFFKKEKIQATDEEINLLIKTILKSIENSKGKLSEGELEQISGGDNNTVKKIVRYTGTTITFPFRVVFYTAGAILASVPRGIADGFYDSWHNWENK